MFIINPIRLGKGLRPKSMYTYLNNYEERVSIFYGIYLIQNGKYNILVDTGVDSKEYSRFSPRHFEDVKTISQGLLDFGLNTNDINFIIQTHLHFDHTAFLKNFPNVKKYLQKKELEYALNPHSLFKNLYYKPYFEDVEFELIDGDRNILPGLDVIFLPGHSPGCQGVLVETKMGKVALTGFCCITNNFVQNDNKKTLIIPTYHENPFLAYESMQKIKQIADYVYPIHEAELVKV